MRLTALAFAAFAASAAPAAASVIIDAHFTGTVAPGTVNLEIDLPDNANNNTTAATAVYVTSATIGLPGPTPFNTINYADSNSFTLRNGVLTGYDYLSEEIQNRKLIIALQFTSEGDILQVGSGQVDNADARLFVVDSVKLPPSSTSVPEPATLALLGAGLVGLTLVVQSRRIRR